MVWPLCSLVAAAFSESIVILQTGINDLSSCLLVKNPNGILPFQRCCRTMICRGIPCGIPLTVAIERLSALDEFDFAGSPLDDIDSRNVLECGGSSHRFPFTPNTGDGAGVGIAFLIASYRRRSPSDYRNL